MPQSSTASILPIFNPELTNKSESSGYNWKTLTKAGLVFVTTTGAFLALKTTGSFSLISSWLQGTKTEFNDGETALIKNFPVTQHTRKLMEFSSSSIINEAPILVNNSLSIMKGGTRILDTETLGATDSDNSDAELLFTVSDSQHGEFQFVNGTVITEFTQQEITARNIRFVHDNTNVAPTYQVSVSDGSLNTVPTHPLVTFSAYAPFQKEFRVNTYTTDAQRDWRVSSLNNEKFMVVWESKDGPEFHEIGIYGQLFDGNANKIGDEFQIDTYTIQRQDNPSIAKLNDGKLIVVWNSAGGTSGQFYDANGNPVLSELILGTGSNPDVAALENGNFVIGWMAPDGWNNGISGQLFNSDGDKIGNEFQVNTYTTGDQVTPSTTALRDDEFVIMWEGVNVDDDYGVFGQLFKANGTKIGSEFRINTHTTDWQRLASGVKISNDKFLATWDSRNQDVSGYSIYGQYFYVNGTKIGGEFPVSSYSTLSTQNNCKGVRLPEGMFVLVFYRYFESVLGHQTVAQFFDEDGTKIGDEFMVNTPINGTTQYVPSIATLSDNKFVVVWDTFVRDGDSYDGWGQLFRKDIAPILTNNTLTIDEDQTVILTNYELSALDIDDDDLNLIFSTNNTQHGQFELVNNGTVVIDFTQQQIIDGNVQFVHDGSANSPSYDVAVSDGILSTSPVPAIVTFSLIFCNEFQVNTYTAGIQRFPAVASLSNSTFAVTWSSDGQDGDNYGIFGQLFNTNGSKLGNEFQINTYTTSYQDYSRIIGLNDERFVVTWQGASSQDDYGISGQMFYTNGTKFGTEFQVNTYTAGSQDCSAIAGLNDEKFIIAWNELSGHDGDGYGVYGQLYHTNGTRDGFEFLINTSTGGQQAHPAISSISNDKFVVTWHSPDASSYGIFGQMFYVNGTKLGPEFQVNSYTSNYQKTPSITRLGNDKFVISWTSDIQDDSSWGIFGQIFNVNGTKFGPEFPINSYTTDAQIYSTVVELQNGEFVVTWASTGQDGFGDGVYGQRFSVEVTGAIKRGPEFRVNTYTENNQQCPRIATLANDDLVITWMSENQDGSDYGIYAMITPPGGCIISSSSSYTSPAKSESVVSSSKSKVISSSSPVSQSATQSKISASTSKSSTSELTTSDSLSSIKSEASSRISTPLSSSEFNLSSESKALSSSLSIAKSTSSKTSESEIPSSTPSASQSTTQSKTSESTSKSTSKEVSSTQALSGSSNYTTTSNKSLLGIILGSIGGLITTATTIFGAWLKYKKYKATSKMRRQNPLAAEIHKHLHLNISSFESEKGRKYLDIVKGIMGDLEKRGVATDEMDQEELRTLTLHSVKAIKDKVEPKKTWIGRKQIPVEDLENAKDSIIKKIAKKCAKGKGKNEIALQMIDDEKKSSASPTKRSGTIDPDKLGKFKKIGQGAMGVVYKAQYHGSDVAVKQLPINAADSDELKQFEQEAKIMKKLRYPHLVSFYGYYQDPTHYSIVMEYVSGGSLDEILYDTQQPFPWYPTRWDIAHDIASAVSFLHNKDIIHRDLKSQNVLVYYEKDRMRAKVADVGIAKIIKQETISTMTKGMGTPLWMAPEVIEAQGEGKKITYDEKVDVYSYGIILSELINRKAPYSEVKNLFHIIPQVLEGNRPAVDEASAPAGFIALMQRCWAQRATERPKMQEVVDNLDQIEEEVRSFEC